MGPLDHRLGIFVVPLLAVILAACSGASSSGSSSPSEAALAPVDPCSVFSAGDIQTALGSAPQGATKRDNMGVTDDCAWTLPSGAELHVTFFNPVGAAKFYTPQVSSKTAREKKYEPITGLGDEAVYRDDSSAVVTVSESVEVVSGKRHFDVHYVEALGKGVGPSRETMASLARTVLAHIH